MRLMFILMLMAILAFGDYNSEIERLKFQFKVFEFKTKADDVALEVAVFCINLALTENSNLNDCEKFGDDKRAYLKKEYKSFFKDTSDIDLFFDDYNKDYSIIVELIGDCIYDANMDFYRKDKLKHCEHKIWKELRVINGKEMLKIGFDIEYLQKMRK